MNRTLIVILTWNRLKLTKNTLKTIFKQNNRKDIDILFIDNGSTDGTIDYLKNKGYDIIKNKINEGIFKASTETWMKGVKRGYDFILNLQNDFPCTRPIPFNILEKYLDDNDNIGFIRLNKKKDKKKNIVTKKPILYSKSETFGPYSISKCNYHASFNPIIMKSSIVQSFVKYDGDNPRERILMNNFNEMGLKCAKLMPEIFNTLRQGDHKGGWKH